jgi:succinoglycan biosynthesis transport protein ExoP
MIDTTKPNAVPRGLDSRDLGLDWLLQVLWARRYVMLFASLLGAAVSVVYLIFATPNYEATARILIDDQRPRVTSAQEIIPPPRFDLGVTMVTQVIESQIALLESREIAEKVINNYDLFADVTVPTASSESERQRAMMEARLANFMRHLSVRRHGLTFIVVVSYRDSDSGRAAEVANAVAEAYIAREVDAKNRAKREAIEWLRTRAKELHERVSDESHRLEDFKTRNDLVSIGGELLKEREILGTLERLIVARVEVAGAEARAKLTEEVAKDPSRLEELSMALQSPVITEHRKQYADVTRRLTQVESRFGEGHRDAVAIRAELADLQKEIAKEATRLVENARSEAEVARVRAKIQEHELTKLIHELDGGRELTVKLRELELDNKTTKDVYASLLTRLKESEMQASLESTDARIVSYAKPPVEADWPRWKIVLASGVLGGLWLSLALLLLQEHFLGIVRSPSAIKDDERLHSVTVMPMIGQGTGTWLNGLYRQLFPMVARKSDSNGATRHTLASMSSAYAQAVFAIRSLIGTSQSRSNGRIVAVVSAQESEGKTTTAINLADYLALAGEKVLLVDCDLRTPKLTALCAPNPASSIVDIASGAIDPEAVIVREPNSGFSFCPGPHHRECRQPMEVLLSRRLAAFLMKCQTDYDVVLLDTTPLLDYVDSRALIGLVDLAILIVEYGRTTTGQVNEVLEQLATNRNLRIGVVINKAPATQAR